MFRYSRSVNRYRPAGYAGAVAGVANRLTTRSARMRTTLRDEPDAADATGRPDWEEHDAGSRAGGRARGAVGGEGVEDGDLQPVPAGRKRVDGSVAVGPLELGEEQMHGLVVQGWVPETVLPHPFRARPEVGEEVR